MITFPESFLEDPVAGGGFTRLDPEDVGSNVVAATGETGNVVKPPNVPETWVAGPTKKNGGVKYTNPDNPNDFIRVMPGNPNSNYPAQQQPYVINSRNGQIVDINGNPVSSNDPAAHIPLSDFEFTK